MKKISNVPFAKTVVGVLKTFNEILMYGKVKKETHIETATFFK